MWMFCRTSVDRFSLCRHGDQSKLECLVHNECRTSWAIGDRPTSVRSSGCGKHGHGQHQPPRSVDSSDDCIGTCRRVHPHASICATLTITTCRQSSDRRRESNGNDRNRFLDVTSASRGSCPRFSGRQPGQERPVEVSLFTSRLTRRLCNRDGVCSRGFH